MSRAVFILIAVILSWSLVSARQAYAESRTLAQSVATALKRSPGLAAARAQVDAARSTLWQARLSGLPRLRAVSSFTRGDDPVYVFGSRLRQGRFTAADFDVATLNRPALLNDYASSLEIGMPLLTASALWTARRMGALGLQAALDRLEAAEQGLRARVVRVYLQTVFQEALRAGYAEHAAEAERSMEYARGLGRKGMVLGADFQAATAILDALRLRSLQAQHAKETAAKTLAVLSGTGPVQTAGRLGEAPYRLETVAELTERALARRADIRQADTDAVASDAVSGREAASWLPTLEAFGSYQADGGQFAHGPSHQVYGLRAVLPFGDPAYLARRNAAKSMQRASQSAKSQVIETAEIEVLEAQGSYLAASESLAMARSAAEAARGSQTTMRALYREGRGSIIDVLRGEEGSAMAQAMYLETLYRLHVGRAAVYLATGDLDEDAVAEIGSYIDREAP